ncbi:MAG: class I tRNA ligase family protein, partial [bacterium]|nr:class I tRNA ligase family protein [bacterium]
KKVSEDIERFAFNTAISQLMIFLNHIEKLEQIPAAIFKKLVPLIAPFAPHITEELWHELGNTGSVHAAPWPTFDGEKARSDTKTIAIQVNGKLRGTLQIGEETSEEEVRNEARTKPEVKKWLDGKNVKKVIFISGRTINFVVE